MARAWLLVKSMATCWAGPDLGVALDPGDQERLIGELRGRSEAAAVRHRERDDLAVPLSLSTQPHAFIQRSCWSVALDYENCVANGTCPHLARLGETGVTYTRTSTSKPSDSFPGLMALVTGGTPKTVGAYYDVAFDRVLAPPAVDTGNGLEHGPCGCELEHRGASRCKDGVGAVLRGGAGSEWGRLDRQFREHSVLRPAQGQRGPQLDRRENSSWYRPGAGPHHSSA